MPFAVGARLGPYELLSVLGTGGMGEVYLARDHRLHRRVAIKARRLRGQTDEDDRRRVLHEGRAAARLNHPRIASVYDVLEHGDSLLLVMELVEGETLRNTLTKGPLPVDQAVDVAVELCEALGAAHVQGVVHGDIKPENICLTPDGHIKVLDFGVSHLAPLGSGVTFTETAETLGQVGFAGTPQYAAPEQFEGLPASARSDIYSAASVLFEMLSGLPPFRGKDALEIGLQVLHESPPHIDALVPGIPQPVADAVYLALSRRPEARPSSATELAQLLSAARTPVAPERVGPDGKRRTSATVAVLTSGLVLIMVLLGVWVSLHWQAPPAGHVNGPPVVAVLPLSDSGGGIGAAALGAGLGDALTANLASVPGIVTVARSNSAAAARDRSDLAKIARNLGATYLVDGSVQLNGETTLVTLTLVRADATVIWGHTYEGRVDDIMTLQRQVATGLSGALALRLSSQEQARLSKPATTNTAALTEYSAAREKLTRPDLSGNIELATAGFRRALALDATFVLAHVGLAEAYLAEFRQTKNPEALSGAIPPAQEAARLDPASGPALVALGTAYSEGGNLKDAVAAFDSALRLQPTSDDAQRGLGSTLAREGQLDKAALAFQEAIKLRPAFWQNWHEYGRFLFSCGRLDDALKAFQEVVKLQPDSPRGYQGMGATYQAQGKIEAAAASYRQALRFGPSVNTSLNLGVLEYWMGHFESAATAYQDAAALAPDDPLPVLSLGDTYTHLGKRLEARRAYLGSLSLVEAQLRLDERSPSLISLHGLVLAKMGRHAEADARTRTAKQAAPQDAEVAYRRAVVLALGGQLPEGRREYQRALQLGYPSELLERDDDITVLRK